YLLNFRVTDSRFQSIPSNPNLYSQIDTYLDRDLTQKISTIEVNQKFKIKSIEINKTNQQVFLLENGQYIFADSSLIYDDIILESIPTQKDLWIKKDFKVYSSPIGNQQKE
ncbi:DUF5776 domain-containing protein, partial [Streptococcus pyogenes]